MTLQEAEQQVDICERELESAYNNLRSAARDVGTAGYRVTLNEKEKIEHNLKKAMVIRRNCLFGLLISLCVIALLAIILSSVLYALLAVVLLGFIFLALDFYIGSTERIKEADEILNSVNRELKKLNDILV